ncbi:hypothetical protein UPYG_G00275360 [Umbra pygmaea]|uniref:Testis-expressed protein 15 n=1 Tax=Umbra pygmaea TaxID=75934 RepID=A0ABD0W351_UMBPY
MALPFQTSSQAIDPALKDFIIPRKKRRDGKAGHLSPCPGDSRDFSLIQFILNESRLDMTKEISLPWHWDSVNLIHNEELLQEFSEKRSEMRLSDRHIREVEERFCFLVTSNQKAMHIYQHGLKVENTDEHSLGNPSYGVYLHKHVDVALKNISGTTAGKVLIIFKVLFGKVKKVPPCFRRNISHDPTVNFDCYMSKDPAVPWDSLHQQVLISSVFLFDYNKNQELKLRPRQCLPYAMVSLIPVIKNSMTSIPVPSMKMSPTTKDSVAFLEGCTVAQRVGRGQNATVTFKHFGSSEGVSMARFHRGDPPNIRNTSSSSDQSYRKGGDPVLSPHRTRDQLQPLPPHLVSRMPQQSVAPFDFSTSFHGSIVDSELVPEPMLLPIPAHTAPMDHNNLCYGNQAQSSRHISNTLSTEQDSSRQQSSYVTGALEPISCTGHASRAIKDPRLSARETNNTQRSISNESDSGPQNIFKFTETQEHNNHNLTKQDQTVRETGIENDQMSCQTRTPTGSSTLENSLFPSTVTLSADNHPSSGMLGVKFQKCSPYFHLTKEESSEKIWSLKHLSLHENISLLDRTNIYETFCQKSICLNQNPTQNVKVTTAADGQLCTSSKNISLSSRDTREMCNIQKTNLDTQLVVRQHYLPQNSMNCDKYSEMDASTSNRHPSIIDGAVEESVERNTDHSKGEDMNICSAEPIRETQEDGQKITEEEQEETGMKNDPQIPFHPERSTAESELVTKVRPNPYCLREHNSPDAFNANLDASRQSTGTGTKLNSVTEETSQGSGTVISEENRQIRTKCKTILATEEKTQSSNEKPSDPMGSIIFESHINLMATSEEVLDTETSEKAEQSCPEVLLSQDHESLLQEDGDWNGTAANPEKYLKTTSTCDIFDAAEIDGSQANDTLYSFLFKRLQLSELSSPPNQNGTCSISGKHYLKPKCKDSTTYVNASLDRRKHSNICITINADREYTVVTELQSLSKRFSASEFLEGTRGSPTAWDNKKLTNHRVTTENTAIGCVYTQTTHHTFNQAHARNAKLIKMMAEKNKGKENASLTKMRDHRNSIAKKRHIIEKHIADIPYIKRFNYSSQTSRGPVQRPVLQSDKGYLKVPHKYRNLKQKNISPKLVRRSAKDRTLANKYKSNPTKAIAHNISVSNYSKSSNRFPIQFRKSIMKMTKLGRRSNHGGYKRINRQSIMPNDPEKSIQSSPTSENNEVLRSNTFDKKQTKRPSRDNKQAMGDGSEKINKENQVADNDTETSSSIEMGNEENATSISVSTTSSFTEEAAHLSNTDNQKIERNCTFHQKNLLTIKCTNIVDLNERNDGETICKKQEAYLQQEIEFQAKTNPVQEVEQANTVMAPAKEIISVSENTEFPLDDAIEILCGSVINSNKPKPQEEIGLVLPQTYGQIGTEKADTLDIAHYCTPQEQEGQIDTSYREVKLITRLRDYLTNFESVVQKSDPTTPDILCETETNSPAICETFQKTDKNDQPVQLVVLDRVELSHLRPNALPIRKKLHTPFINTKNHLFHYKEQEQMNKTTGYNKNDYNPCISPDSTSMLEIPEKTIVTHLSKSTTEAEISTSVPDDHWITNADNSASTGLQREPKGTVDVNSIIMLKALAKLEPDNSKFGKRNANITRKQTSHVVKMNTKSFHRNFTLADISNTLKLVDKAASLVELSPIRTKCKVMLQYFILNFERKQNVEVNTTIISRDQILDRYLECPPLPMDLKYEALNSFLDLQIMMEAWQFIDNKMRYLSGQSTFRSLLWYDPTLYGELFKGKVGFQQQSSLYSSFQQSLVNEGPIALQRYHLAVSTLNQQLQRAPQMSYYMYLKSKRERLEIEAALRNPNDTESFFLSVPLSCMVNFGNTVESLQKVQKLVTNFTKTPADKLEAGFDVGKAEHLAMVFRFLQEKICYLKACNNTMVSKTSWFGMEHILYDASKILVWREAKQTVPHDQLAKYKKANPDIIYEMTESGVSLLHAKISRKTQQILSSGTTSPRSMLANRVYRDRGLGRGRLRMDATRFAKNQCKEHESMPVIDLTKSPHRDNHTSTHTTHFQTQTHQEKLANNQRVNWVERLSDTQVIKRNIPLSLPQPVPKYPEIRACLTSNKRVTAPGSQIQLPTPMRGVAGNSDRHQRIVNWNLPNHQDFCNMTGSYLQPVPPLWVGVMEHAPTREPALSQQTHPPSWSGLFSPPLQHSSSVAGDMTAQQTLRPQPSLASDNRGPAVYETPSMNYPFFLLNGQTYSTANPDFPTATFDNKEALPLYPM